MTLDGCCRTGKKQCQIADVDETGATYRASLLKISMRWLQTTVRTDADEVVRGAKGS